MAAIGASTYIVGVYIDPVADEFSLPRAMVGLSTSAGFAVSAFLTPLVGVWLDRGATRLVMTLGALFFSLGLVALSLSTQPWQLLLALLGPCALGVTMLGVVPASKLTASWFERHRGKALGIAAIGTSIGGLVVPQAVVALIARTGWRESLLYLAAVVALGVMPMFWCWVVSTPKALGQRSDGALSAGALAPIIVGVREIRELALPLLLIAAVAVMFWFPFAMPLPALGGFRFALPLLALAPLLWWLAASSMSRHTHGAQAGPAAAPPPFALAATLGSRAFWGIALPFMLIAAATTMLLTYLVPYVKEIGLSAQQGANMLSLYAIFSIMGKLGYGVLLDRLDKRWVFASVPLILGITWPLLFLSPNPWTVGLVAIVAGLGTGGILPVWNALVAERFGLFRFGRVIGMMGMAATPLTMSSVWFGGRMFDSAGSYLPAFEWAFWAFPLAFLTIALVMPASPKISPAAALPADAKGPVERR